MQTQALVAPILAIGLAIGVGTPALAQQSQQPQQSQQSGTQANPHNAAAMQQTVKQDLEQAGFTQVQVMPQSFLVRAHDKHNNPVMMLINPDSVTSVTALNTSDNNAQQGGSAQGKSTTASK